MTFRIPMTGAALAALLVLAGCEEAGSLAQVEPVTVPAAAGSFAPQLFDAHGTVSLSWLETKGDGHALRYSTWSGSEWNEPRTVASGEDWFANWADLPGVRRLGDGGWVAWWLQKSAPATYAYDVQLAFSKDGTQWKPYGSPHADGTATEHGFVTAFDLSGGGFGLAWLDGRKTGGAHGAHGTNGMTLRYGMFDANGRLAEEAEYDGLTCDCCQTDSVATDDGVVMVYRDRTEAEIRDMHAARYVDGEWSESVRVHADGWKIDGCPVNGPAIAAAGKRIGVAWFTAPEGKGEVRFAWSVDGGRTFAAPVRIDGGRPQGRVDVVMHPEGDAVVSWVEQGGSGAEVRVRRVTREGELRESRTFVQTDAGRAAGFPRMVALEDGRLLLTWTEVAGEARRVRSALLQP